VSKPVQPLLVTQLQLAEVIGADRNTVAGWTRLGMPVHRRGRGSRGHSYDVGACVRWVRAHDAEQARQKLEAARSTSSLDLARARKMQADAVTSELKAALRQGQLVPIQEVLDAVANTFQVVRTRILALPATLAEQVMVRAAESGAAGVQEILKAGVYDALSQLAAWRPPGGGGGSNGHPATSNGHPVPADRPGAQPGGRAPGGARHAKAGADGGGAALTIAGHQRRPVVRRPR
jgi:phage terminase Nu1 subunit (DNA packaging protein)